MKSGDLSAATKAWEAAGRYVTADGKRIFVVERGTGPAVLLLHGFPTSCYDWRGVMDILSRDSRTLAFDFPGYGLSDKPVAYSYSLFQQADVVEAVAKTLGVTKAHVVSHDMGTSVHCELLAREQERRLGLQVASSTFLNGSMLQWMATITPFQELLASNKTLPQAIELCNSGALDYVPRLKGLMKRPDCISDEHATVMEDLFRHQDGNRRVPALSGYMRERYIHKERWLGALGAVRGPVQFVWADGDPIANVVMGRELHRLYPTARYVELAGLGHFLLMEDPPAVAAEIRKLVAT